MKTNNLKKRFDGYLPIVIDIETAGVDPTVNSMLEIAAVEVKIENQIFQPGENLICHVNPFTGSKIDPEALEINKIDPYHPFRFAIDEQPALEKLFEFTVKKLKLYQCRRAVLVGHNAHFDLSFIQAAMRRCKIKNGPYHSFTCFDTATLSGLVFGKTILAKALKSAKIKFDHKKAHSAIYDAERTAELFCYILNNTSLPKPIILPKN